MPRRSLSCALLLVLLALRLMAPSAAVASGFTQSWSVAGWTFGQDLGNTDGDPQHEVMFSSNADGHLAIFDGLTGAIQQEFPGFTSGNTSFTAVDIDGDGRAELFFQRLAPALFTAYRWNGASDVPIFSHADPLDNWQLAHVRNATALDILESGGNDFRVRDLTGAVLYRASVSIAGWSGQSPQFVTPTDVNHDGVSEILINDHDRTRLVSYAGSFTQSWSASGWQFPSDAGNLDGDPQSEILVDNTVGGRYAILDGLTGAVDKEFPDFTIFNASAQPYALDPSGPHYLFFSIQPGLGSPLFRGYHWNGSSLATLFSATDPFDTWSVQHFRNSAQFEILEQGQHDFRLRDLAGNVLFHAATDIPGWSGADPCYTSDLDVDHDGIAELLINDHDKVRLLKYAGSFTQAWVANGWQVGEDIGNTDGDAQDEILLASTADDHYALFDGLTGALEKALPEFAIGQSGYVTADIDGTGRNSLFLYHYLLPGQSPLFKAFRWNGSGYTTMFAHTDSLGGADIRSLRHAGQFEVLEAGPSDVRLRDMSGAVIFRASSDVPGWAGLDPNSGSPINSLDADADDLPELVVTDQARVRLIDYPHSAAVPGPTTPVAFQAFQNEPNPFRTHTSFRIMTPKEGEVDVRIFDASGRLIRRLDQRLAAGNHAILWDGKDEAGRTAPSGVLFYQVSLEGFRQTRKLVRVQ